MTQTFADTSPGLEKKPFFFLQRFLRHGTRVASVAPSSSALATAMCRGITPDRPQTIVELGAGTGAVTRRALARMHPHGRLIAIELDREFARVLRFNCPVATVMEGDVRDLPRLLEQAGVDRFDLLLNGLPTPSLPRSLNAIVLETLAEKSPAAECSQLTIMPYVYAKAYRRIFQEVEFQLVLRNLPPGGVYHCRGMRAGWRDHLPGKRQGL